MPSSSARLGVILEVEDQAVVHVVLDVGALGDDHHVVELVELEELLPAGLVDQLGGDLFPLGSPDGLFAHQAGSSSSTGQATFVVDESRDAGQLDFIADLVLVAPDDPTCFGPCS